MKYKVYLIIGTKIRYKDKQIKLNKQKTPHFADAINLKTSYGYSRKKNKSEFQLSVRAKKKVPLPTVQ